MELLFHCKWCHVKEILIINAISARHRSRYSALSPVIVVAAVKLKISNGEVNNMLNMITNPNTKSSEGPHRPRTITKIGSGAMEE
jgi:hypothetical protein